MRPEALNFINTHPNGQTVTHQQILPTLLNLFKPTKLMMPSSTDFEFSP